MDSKPAEPLIAPGQQIHMGACEVCWTCSWEPVPPDDPDAQEVIYGNLRGTFVRCLACWQREQIATLRADLGRVREAVKHAAWRAHGDRDGCDGCLNVRAALATPEESRGGGER